MAQPPLTPPSLFLRDEELRRGLALLLVAHRDLGGDSDDLLEKRGLGRAHMRALYFIGQCPGTPVSGLLRLLRITKQSLSRVLNDLVDQGYVRSEPGQQDRRQRLLWLTQAGTQLEQQLFATVRTRIVNAYRAAGPEAVAGFWKVLLALVDSNDRQAIENLSAGLAEG